MLWDRYRERDDRIDRALDRLRLRLLPQQQVAGFEEEDVDDELRLFPIVGRDVCYPVASLLARGKLEEAGRLVPERAWVASVPLYG
jgi:hypothetical protein